MLQAGKVESHAQQLREEIRRQVSIVTAAGERARARAQSEAELREVQRQLMYLLEELRANRARPTDREAVMRRWRARVE